MRTAEQKEKARLWMQAYRQTEKGRRAMLEDNCRRQHTTRRLFDIVIEAVLRDLIEETRKREAQFRQALEIAEQTEQKSVKKMKRAFINKVFQPVTCADCGANFETLYPPELIAFEVKSVGSKWDGTIRCRDCAYQRRLKNHGGGPRRRCTQYGVPYEIISPGAIFHRDDYKCKLCGGDLNMSAGPHDPKAAEIDHIIPLSTPGSPGHILSNVQSAHRDCNIRKGGDVS
jgi:DNA-directed RNA polymerase subunit RPC12/RpoP